MYVRLIFVALLGMIAVVAPTSASAATSAALNFCNRTANPVNVAVGYYSAGVKDPADHSILTGPFVSRGYWTVMPTQCETFENPFGARYMFWFGWSNGFNEHGHTFNGRGHIDEMAQMRVKPSSYGFCVSNYYGDVIRQVPPFTFEDENASPSACEPIVHGEALDAMNEGEALEAMADAEAVLAKGVKPIWVSARKVDTSVDPNVNFTGE
jgi:uncharacterized membrane protein